MRGKRDAGIEFGDALFGHVDQQLFGGDQGDLQVAVRVALGEQHVHDVVRQRGQQVGVVGAEPAPDERRLGIGGQGGELGGVVRQYIIEFGDHRVHLRDELDESLGRQHHAVIHALVRTFDDDPRNAVDDAGQRHLPGGDLLRDQGDRRLGLQRHFERHVRGRTPHQFDEVPVLQRGTRVLKDVADHLAVDAGGGIEAEGNRQQVADLQVAVDRFGYADHLHAGTVGLDA